MFYIYFGLSGRASGEKVEPEPSPDAGLSGSSLRAGPPMYRSRSSHADL